MSRFWPHTQYAEDQAYPHLILSTHIFTRAFQAGSLIGSGIGTGLYVLRNFNVLAPKIPPSTFPATVLRSTGVGAVVGTGALAVVLPLRMRGKEEIEWRDRSWRLLENKGQVECDDWTYPGMALGLLAAVARGKVLAWKGAVGSVGVGGVLGMMGYMGWRYGVKGGSFEENED